jgi:hypothetical protein
MLNLSEIPGTAERPNGSRRDSEALRLLSTRSRRRAILRMVGLSALALGGTVLNWGARGTTGQARAETGPGGLLGWDDCGGDYDPDPDTGGAYVDEPGACNGGSYRASTYCKDGWHRTDRVSQGSATIEYRAVSNRCWSASEGRNSWRWKAGGHTYRCSDGNAYACTNDGCGRYNTVCRARV